MAPNIRIAVVGSINMDLVVESRRMPAPGETRIGTSFIPVPGGKGANQAVAAAPVVDTTAAGDAFTAALGFALASGMSMGEATRFGCAAGSLAVQRAGAQDAMPTREAVDRLVSA